MNRKVLVFILTLALLLCLFPTAAFAAPRIPGESAVPEITEEEAAPAEPEADDVSLALPEATEASVESSVSEGPEAAEEEEPVVPEQSPEERAVAAEFAQQIESDGPYAGSGADGVILGRPESPDDADTMEYSTVSKGESFYAYEGMTVFNNGGTVYNNRATVYNNAGTVFNNGGKVYNNAGIVYANSGIVFNNNGTVYNNEAEIFNADTPDTVGVNRVFGYYELKLADYYEPYIVLEGVTTEPGSEMMIISEDSFCRATPIPGYEIVGAEATVGDLIRDGDGSVILTNVDSDTVLTLEIKAVED